MNLSQLYWHDGNLQSITFEIGATGSSCLILSVLLYDNGQDKERHQYEICCFDVKRFNTGMDATELKNNRFTGNISNAYQKGSHLWVYFTDGILEVEARQYEVTGSSG